MRKLSLDVAALEVQSFRTGVAADAAGTVEAHDSRTPSLTRCITCPGYPCTFDETCGDTCAGFTCGVDSCYDTCHTNICACELSDFGSCVC